MRHRERQKERLCTWCKSCGVFVLKIESENRQRGRQEENTRGKCMTKYVCVCVCVLVQRWITSACIFSAAMPSRTSVAASIYIREI